LRSTAADFTEKAILDNYNARSFYESDVSMLMINVLRSGDVVFDVGANCGYFSVLAASLVGPSGHVVAMEPAPSCLARLKANLQRNAFANVSVVEKVVTEHAGEEIFHLNPRQFRRPRAVESASAGQHLTRVQSGHRFSVVRDHVSSAE